MTGFESRNWVQEWPKWPDYKWMENRINNQNLDKKRLWTNMQEQAKWKDLFYDSDYKEARDNINNWKQDNNMFWQEAKVDAARDITQERLNSSINSINTYLKQQWFNFTLEWLNRNPWAKITWIMQSTPDSYTVITQYPWTTVNDRYNIQFSQGNCYVNVDRFNGNQIMSRSPSSVMPKLNQQKAQPQQSSNQNQRQQWWNFRTYDEVS